MHGVILFTKNGLNCVKLIENKIYLLWELDKFFSGLEEFSPYKGCILASTGTEGSGSLSSQLVPLMGAKSKNPAAAERCLPWRRNRNGTSLDPTLVHA